MGNLKKIGFSLHLRGAVPKNGRGFCLDKRLSSYIVVDMFVRVGVFLVTSTLTLTDQGFYAKFSYGLGLHALNTPF